MLYHPGATQGPEALLLETLLSALHWLGVAAYGGSLIAFALMMLSARLLGAPDLRLAVRAWQAWGPGLGLSMGLLIFSGLGLYYLQMGAFTWPMETAAQKLTAAKHGIFLALWASSFQLEIWTMEPLRKADREGDEATWAACAPRVSNQALVHAALFVAVGVLGVMAA